MAAEVETFLYNRKGDRPEGSDIFNADMVDEQKMLGESEIQKFFAGSTIFLTGGTGFLGKLLIEKLLRSCPDLKKIYMLARPKKNKDTQKRLQEQFDDVLYDKLKKVHPDFLTKIEAVEGDVGKLGLGLSEEDRMKITEEVEVIFHGAATVRFDEPIKTAVEINVRGTREMCVLAAHCTRLRAFVHTSTAYSNCPRKHIEEKFYDSPIPYDKIIDMVETLDEKTLQNITPGLLGEWPNTYAFTKAIAEDAVKKLSKGLPVAMIRPAIVIGTYKEPVAGWIDNVYGPTGVVVGAAVGLLHSLHCNPRVIADLVPGDMVVFATIAAAWRAAKDQPVNKEDPPADHLPPIYNYVSSEQRPLTWERYMGFSFEHGVNWYTNKMIWRPSIRLNANYWLHLLNVFFMHTIKGYLLDGLSVVLGKEPQLRKAYVKIAKFSNVISRFCTKEWKFDNSNAKMLYESLNKADKNLFNMDILTIDWSIYMYTCLGGMRVYLVKDPLETIPQAKKKYIWLSLIHYVYVFTLGVMLLLLPRFIFRLFVWVFRIFFN